jgi:hypothetical protein
MSTVCRNLRAWKIIAIQKLKEERPRSRKSKMLSLLSFPIKNRTVRNRSSVIGKAINEETLGNSRCLIDTSKLSKEVSDEMKLRKHEATFRPRRK